MTTEICVLYTKLDSAGYPSKSNAIALFTRRVLARKFADSLGIPVLVDWRRVEGDIERGDTIFVVDRYDQYSNIDYFFEIYCDEGTAIVAAGNQGTVRAMLVNPTPQQAAEPVDQFSFASIFR
jgi:hypothetical protein